MPFSVKDWRDQPDHTTPISAAALEDLETRLGAYADLIAASLSTNWQGVWSSGTTYSRGQGVSRNGINYTSNTNANLNHDPATDGGVNWAPLIPSNVLNLTSPPDVFSRTKVLAQPFPCIMDSPWGAKCDGTTDDSTAVQNAINDVSARGASIGQKVPLIFPPGTNTVLSEVVLASYVDLRGHGAKITRNTGYSTNRQIFVLQPQSGLGTASSTDMAIRGFRLVGTGTENYAQGFLRISEATHITVEDNWVSGSAAAPYVFDDVQYVWVDRNKAINCDQAGGFNSICFNNGAYGTTLPCKHIWVRGNHLEGCAAHGIAMVIQGTANRTDPEVGWHVIGNTSKTDTTHGGIPIVVEIGGTWATNPPSMSGFEITANYCVNGVTSGANALYAIATIYDVSAGAASTDPLGISDVTIIGNPLVQCNGFSLGCGILCQASYATIGMNTIKAAQHDILLAGHGSATIGHIGINPNVGHRGTGDMVHFNTLVDSTTVSAFNSQ